MENEKIWELTKAAVSVSDRVLLHGPAATGKSYLAAKVGLRQGQESYSITLTEETSMSELRGHYLPQGTNNSCWVDGICIRAWREGARLVINEIGEASLEAQTFLHAILDDKAFASYTLPNGEKVIPHQHFSLIATTNADPASLMPALQSRFPVKIFLEKTNPEIIATLPKKYQKIAMGTDTSDKRRIDVRTWMEFIRMQTELDFSDACYLFFGSRAKEIGDMIRLASNEGG